MILLHHIWVYLAMLFLVPLRRLYSYQTNARSALKRMAFRCFVGSCITLVVSITNLTVIMILNGEPGRICFTCCNADTLICITVLHWATSKEDQDQSSTARSTRGAASNKPREIGTGMKGSAMPRNKHMHLDDDKAGDKLPMDMTMHVQGAAAARENALNKSLEPAVITMECMSDKMSPTSNAFAHYRRRSEWNTEAKEGQMDDEIQLRNIHVQTVQTMEVQGPERDRERSFSASASTDREADEWSRKTVVVERMV